MKTTDNHSMKGVEMKLNDINPQEYNTDEVTIESNFACAPTPECDHYVVMYEFSTPEGKNFEVVIKTRDRSVFNAFAEQQSELLTVIPMHSEIVKLSDSDIEGLNMICEMQLEIKQLAPAEYAHEELTRDQGKRDQLSTLLGYGITRAYEEWAELLEQLKREPRNQS